MKLSRWVRITVLAGAASSAVAETTTEAPRRSLADFLRLAQESPQLGEARARVEFAEAREDFARSKAMPFGKLETLVAPVPDAHGNPISGKTDWDSWGPLSLTQLEIVQPIYTFGALSNARKAGRAGVEAEKQLLARESWALRVQISEYYYGYQLAFELSEVADSVLTDLNKAFDKVKNSQTASGKRDADKLTIFIKEAETRRLEAKKFLDQARLGMAWRTGLRGKEVPRWDRANIATREIKLGTLEDYQKICRESRPEWIALQKEVEAKEALANVESSLRYPQIFAGARLVYARTPGREDQKSPFAYDPANEISGGAGLGLRWNLGLFESNAKAAQARAEAMQAQAKHRFLSEGILSEVEKNYLDVQQLQASLQLRADAAAAAKRVFRDLVMAYLLGTSSDAKALLEALGQHVLAEKARLESIFQFNMAVARLEQSIGHTI